MLPFIVRNADESIRADLAQAAIDELNQRIERRHDNETDRAATSNQNWLTPLSSVVANTTDPENAQRVVAFASGCKCRCADRHLRPVFHSCSNFDNVFAVGKRWSVHQLDRDVLAALCLRRSCSCYETGTQGTRTSGNPLPRTPQRWCHQKDLGRKRTSLVCSSEATASDSEFVHDTRRVVYEVILRRAGCRTIWGTKPKDGRQIPSEDSHDDLAERSRESAGTAWQEASQKDGRQSRRWPTLQDIYGAFKLERPTTRSHHTQSSFIAVRLALRDVAVDLCTIAKGLDSNARIDVSDIASASNVAVLAGRTLA